jgi:hypothetical protein
MTRTFEQQVRERAYRLWLREDGMRGHVNRHWFQAVRDTLAEAGRIDNEVNASRPGAERPWRRTRVLDRRPLAEQA